jgi:16S rRNA (uracil1498-N3)-methyltransferase
MKEGSKLSLTDGRGTLYKAEIIEANPKRCVLNVIDTFKDYQKRNYYLHMVVAPTKNIDRFEWFLEKATEIGVDEITPVLCEHSERKTIKPDRLERIIVAAMKQSLKAYKPVLNPITNFKDFIQQPSDNSRGFIAHCNEGDKELLKNSMRAGEHITLFIGPEGDFSPEEVGLATSAGILPVSLGEARLRTETAAVVGCHTISLMNQ